MRTLTPGLSLSAKRYTAVGLMSGTSADGIDAALVEITEDPFKIHLKEFLVFPFTRELRDRVLRAYSPITPLLDIGELDVLLGEAFADAVLKLLRKMKLSADKVDFIGSHGQTIHHQPPSLLTEGGTPFTFQIGDGSVIAQKTGILTVSDFRVADVAQGGEGAPLVPYVDWRLFTHPKKNRVLINIGGIANFTYLPAQGKLSDIVACDTGPGNALLDSLVSLLTHGEFNYDAGGEMASHGNVREELLKDLLAHPYLGQRLPKSADRQLFGRPLAQRVIEAYKDLPSVDLLATATVFTAESIAQHLAKYAPNADEVIASGGGAQNVTLMAFLKRLLDKRLKREIPFIAPEELGISGKAKEAVAFVILAYETLRGTPSNVPNVTGAHQGCVLGKISQGWRKTWKIL